jgi:hypothetical protein
MRTWQRRGVLLASTGALLGLTGVTLAQATGFHAVQPPWAASTALAATAPVQTTAPTSGQQASPSEQPEAAET